MSDQEEMLHLGTYDPRDAKKILQMLESLKIPFEIEMDHSALLKPNRAVSLYLGMYPEGSKMAIYVRDADLVAAQVVIEQLFPV